LGNAQFVGGAGEMHMPGGRFEYAQGIQRRQVAGHKPLAIMDEFYLF